jgi:hypothetical protein
MGTPESDRIALPLPPRRIAVARTVLVTGDVFRPENLLVGERAGTGRADGLDPVAVQPLPGGAWRLADLARAVIEESA